MRQTSPPLDEKLSVYREMKEAGFKGTWDEWMKLEPKPKPLVSVDDYEPPKTAHEELGF
ncbi:MAG: hypothetical protein V3R16_02340 [Nitrospirales bacterium]